MPKNLRILLVDDHILFRKGLIEILEIGQHLVVGEASNGEEAVALALETRPDVILMDLKMPKCNGVEATRIIKQKLPKTHVVVLTVSDQNDHLFEALKSGASGYLLKNLEPQELFDMLDGIGRNEPAISGIVAAKILEELRKPLQSEAAETDINVELTDREMAILKHVITGASNKEIARALSISENTVKIHLRNLMNKLHARNRLEVAVNAVRQNLIE